MKRSGFSSLRVRLILLVLIAVIPAWVAMLYGALGERRLAIAEFQSDVRRLANLAARDEEQWIEGSRQTLIALGRFVYLHLGDRPACNGFFASLLKRYRHYVNFGAINSDGEILCSALPLDHPVKVADRSWFRRAVETHQFTLGGYQIEPVAGEPVLIAAYPVLCPGGRIVAVVFAALDLKWLNRFEFDVEEQLPRGTSLVQIDHTGVILARHPDSENGPGQRLDEGEIVKAVLEKQRGLVEVSAPDGTTWLHAFAPVRPSLKGREVYLILSIRKEAAFAAANRVLRGNLAALGIVVFLALVGVWFGGDLLILRRLRTLVDATRKLAAGHLDARSGVAHGRGELNQLALAFDEMASALQKREVEGRRVQEQLEKSREQLRELSNHLQAATEEERTRISREIHDDLGQVLTALKMDVSWLKKRVPRNQRPVLEKLESMSSLIDKTTKRVQRLSAELRPGILDDFGLPAAIEWQAGEFQERTGIRCKVNVDGEKTNLNREQSTAVFRVFQESLTNVFRHARATEVEVTLRQEDNRLILDVKDNGKGITEEEVTAPGSFGFIGMRERVHPWGGKVKITGARGEGTRVTVTMPFDEETDHHDTSHHSR
ncbi:MAG: HAMP domain-containing protein [Deltaproteobacteria bacterium]|nr:HAMP domain-containing protein [Deltaproteobacteria bacterium]